MGAPWRADAEVAASAVVARVFEGFLNLRSGWEWQVPLYDDGRGRSVDGCTAWVLDRLREASVVTAPLVGGTVVPDEGGSAYDRLVESPDRFATFLIDWTT